MKVEDFEIILERRILNIRKVLSKKAQEYSSGEDRLHNFKRAAAMLQETPESALIGMWTKHIVSILDMVDEVGVKPQSLQQWDEKIGDAINYLILLEALIDERNNEEFDGVIQNERHI